MDNYIKSATDYAINRKTQDLKDFDILVENSRESLCMLQSFIPNSKIAEYIYVVIIETVCKLWILNTTDCLISYMTHKSN